MRSSRNITSGRSLQFAFKLLFTGWCRANNPFIADSWGDGYIAILDVLPPTPVKMFDNRAQQDDNGVIRQEGCATNPRNNPEECPPLFDRKDPTYSDCVNYCRDGETFWSYTGKMHSCTCQIYLRSKIDLCVCNAAMQTFM